MKITIDFPVKLDAELTGIADAAGFATPADMCREYLRDCVIVNRKNLARVQAATDAIATAKADLVNVVVEKKATLAT
jgi:hypothetical protein